MGDELFQGQMHLTRAVGSLEATCKALDKGQSRIFKKLDELTTELAKANTSYVRTKAEIENVSGDVAYLKTHIRKKVDPVIEDYKAKKNRFAGFLIGAGTIGGAAGLSIKSVLVKLGILGG